MLLSNSLGLAMVTNPQGVSSSVYYIKHALSGDVVLSSEGISEMSQCSAAQFNILCTALKTNFILCYRRII